MAVDPLWQVTVDQRLDSEIGRAHIASAWPRPPAGAQCVQVLSGRAVSVDPADSWVVFVGAGAEPVASEVVGVAAGGAVLTACRDAFEVELPMHRCGVACLRRLDGHDMTWLTALSRRFAHAPVVVVTPLCPDAVAAMATLPGGAPPFVWAENVAVRLAQAVPEQVERDPVQQLVTIVRADLPMSPVVHSALRRLMKARPPVTGVRVLAEALAVPRETLYAHWRAAFGGGLTPKEFMEWVLILRALSSGGRTTVRMAAEVGVDKRTLERICGRRLGLTPVAARRRGVTPALGDSVERVSYLLA